MQNSNTTLQSLETILRELNKLGQENDFKGVYIDAKYLHNIQHTFKDIINSMNLDSN